MNVAELLALLENVNHVPKVVRELVVLVGELRAELDTLKAANSSKVDAPEAAKPGA